MQDIALHGVAFDEAAAIEGREIGDAATAVNLDVFGARSECDARAGAGRRGGQCSELTTEAHELEREQ